MKCHIFRKKKKYEKWWARQLEHKRRLDEYSVRTADAASQHSIISGLSDDKPSSDHQLDDHQGADDTDRHQEADDTDSHLEENTESHREEENETDTDNIPEMRRPVMMRKKPDSRILKDFEVNKDEIEAIIGTAESRKSVRRSYYGARALTPGGSYTLDLGSPFAARRSMQIYGGTLK